MEDVPAVSAMGVEEVLARPSPRTSGERSSCRGVLVEEEDPVPEKLLPLDAAEVSRGEALTMTGDPVTEEGHLGAGGEGRRGCGGAEGQTAMAPCMTIMTASRTWGRAWYSER